MSRRASAWFVLGAVLGFIFSAGAQPVAHVEWIDVHTHLIGGARGDFSGAVREAIAVMDRAGIRTSVVMPPPFTSAVPNRHDFGDFQHALKDYPGRFAFLGGGGTLNLMLERTAAGSATDAQTRSDFERAANEILDAGASGFGEIAVHHLSHMPGHPYEWIAADHPLLLILADIAASRDAVIDLHLDLVLRDMELPPRFQSPPNPAVLKANFDGFERLLAHNRKAKIVWAHAGSDQLGHCTPELIRALLRRHPNLHMSLRFPAGLPAKGSSLSAPPHLAFNQGRPSPQWLELVSEFSDRFVLGGDYFVPGPLVLGQGPGLQFAKLSAAQRELAGRFLSALPAEAARKVGIENAARLYLARR